MTDQEQSVIASLIRDRFDAMDKKLADIHTEVKKTNGRVNDHDDRLEAIEDRHDRGVKLRKLLVRGAWTLLVSAVCGGAVTLAQILH